VVVRRGRRSGLYGIVAIHSTVRGPSLGGCRMFRYGDARAALRDALRLSRAMTFKAAVADLPLGGGKGVIMLPLSEGGPSGHRRATLLDFADTVESLGGAYITAEDVGTSSRDMRLIASRTNHVAGLPRRMGGSGDPSPLTALGVHAAIRACCQRVFDSPSLSGRTIAVIGLGQVGGRVARRCAADGARLVVADVDAGKRRLAEELGALWITPDRAIEADVDVLSPCALGGILDDESVQLLRCAVIAGGANNQLADDRVADSLAARGILWAPDFVVNAGGIINIAEELDGYDPARARHKVAGIAGTLAQIFDAAQTTRATPLAAALELARARLRAAEPEAVGDRRAAAWRSVSASASRATRTVGAAAPPPAAAPPLRACRGAPRA
jgi:leucine dehydrogenase